MGKTTIISTIADTISLLYYKSYSSLSRRVSLNQKKLIFYCFVAFLHENFAPTLNNITTLKHSVPKRHLLIC